MRNRSVIRGLGVACAMGILAAPRAQAEEVITPVGVSDEAAAVVVQPDGKIILAGYAVLPTQVDFALVRYHPDLTLDVSFDSDGMLTTDIASGADYARGIALQSDGKIVVAGYATVATEDFAVVRYNVDGSLDTSFDGDGIVTTALRSPDRADRGHAVVIQPDGKIVVAGESERSPGNRDFAVVRYNANGSLDTSFDGDGIALTGLRSPDRSDRAFSLALQSDGKIVVAGYIDDAPNFDVAVVRYNANGSLDTSFDGDGIATLDLSPNDLAYGVAIQADGKIVVVGQTQGTFADILLLRYDSNGVLDPTFDGDGIVTTDVTPGSIEAAHGVTIQPDGKIVVAGVHNFTSIWFMVARYNPNGSLDTTCDGDGVRSVDIGNDIQDDEARAVALQGADKIVAAGYTSPVGDFHFAALRLDGNCATSAVELESFEAQGEDGAAELTWKTASELNNLGFHVHRSTSEEGPYAPVTEAAIPGLGSSPVGAEYRFRDTGLTNGVTYYYKLEDIETTGLSTFHGPVSVTPSPAFAPRVSSSPPSPVSSASSLIVYGNPENNRLRVWSANRVETVLELETAGFYAEPQGNGTVRILVPDFDLPLEQGAVSIPRRRSWVEVQAGRKVAISSVRELDVETIGLTPPNPDVPDIEASERTVRARLRRSFGRQGSAIEPDEPARLLSVGFQQDVKKALVELAPLRWSSTTGELRLARRLVVRLSLREPDPDETGSSGSRRRRHRRITGRAGRNVVARLSTNEPGLYEVPYEDLFGRGSVSLDSVRLSRQGEPVAFHVEPPGASFGRGSCLYFVSEGARANPYGQEAVYELEIGEAEGSLHMERASAAPTSGETDFYWEHLEREENRYYQAALLDAPDSWLWDILFAPVTKSYSFEVSRLAPHGVASSLRAWLSGTSDFAANPDHHLEVYVNGSLVADRSWDGKQWTRIDAELPPGLLVEGENTLEVRNVGDTEAPYSMVMLDRFEVDYPRQMLADDGWLEGLWTESGTAALSLPGRLGGVHLLDVTAKRPLWLDGGMGSEGAFAFHAEAGRRYLAVARDAVRRPNVRRAPSSPVRLTDENHGAEYLVVGPQEFLEGAEPLLKLRRSQGLRVLAVPIETIFDDFGHGERRPEALKTFLTYAYHQWRGPRVRYVLLLGDGLYDYKNYLGTGNTNHVPPLLVRTSFLWTASDPTLAAVNGDDILPDVAIGRLPAKDEEELRILIDKILAYENGAAGLSDVLVLVADDPDAAGDFVDNANEIARDVLSGRDVRKLYLSERGAAAMREGIRDAFDSGASLVSYIGHGGIHLWAGENIFGTEDVASLSPQAQQPLFVTMNCLNGYFHFPYFDSLAERILKAEGRGAIAAFSPSGLSFNAPAHRLHSALLEAVFHGGHRRLGDAVLAAQSAYADTGAFPELLQIYHLLGDPALTLK